MLRVEEAFLTAGTNQTNSQRRILWCCVGEEYNKIIWFQLSTGLIIGVGHRKEIRKVANHFSHHQAS